MFTFKQYLAEVWHSSEKLTGTMINDMKSMGEYQGQTHYDIFKNPTGKEMKEISHPVDKEFRALIHNGEMYAWNPAHAMHSHVRQSLGLPYNHNSEDHSQIDMYVRVHHDPKQRRIQIWHGDPDDHNGFQERLKNHNAYFNSEHYTRNFKDRGYSVESIS